MRFAAHIVTLGLVLGRLACPASATDFLIPGGITEIAPITLSGDGDTLTVEESGELSVASMGAAVQVTADEFVISNAGIIRYLDDGSAINADSALNGLIINWQSGLIGGMVGISTQSSSLYILNAGSIEALDSAVITIFSELTLVNSGTITGFNGIDATLGRVDILNSSQITGTNYGVRLNGTTVSSLVNSGVISGDEGVHQHNSELTATNTGTIDGSSVGFSVHDGSTLDLFNSGIIEGGDNGLYVYDDLASDTTVANVVNTGTISGGEAGVRVQDAELSLVNTGSITGSIGLLQAGTGHVDLVNAGRISGVTSLSLEGSGNSVTLLPGSILEGPIYLTDTNNDFIIGKGLNVLLAFDAAGVMPASIDTSGMPYVVDPASYRITILDATAFAMADEMLDDLAVQVLDAVPSQGRGIWSRTFGSRRDQEEGQAAWSSDHRMNGILTGVDAAFATKLRGGVFLGGASGVLEVDDEAQELQTDSVYGGLHLAGHWEGGFTRTVLLAGWQEHDSRRNIADNSTAGGQGAAEASYGAFFFVPEITFGHDFGRLTSSLSARYAGLFLEAYDETGSSADLAVESRAVHNLASRLEFTVPNHIPLQEASLLLEPRLGAEVRTGLGNQDVAVELLGADLQFDAAAEELVLTIFSGAAATFRSAQGSVSLRLSGDAAIASDGSTVISAGLGGEIVF